MNLQRQRTRSRAPVVRRDANHEAAVNAEREPNFLLAKPEKRLLRAIAARLPRWILPDDLTRLGVAAAIAICAAYQLSNESRAWLWVASALLVVHWLGDSLDGTLARVRKIERPRYGYYLDHLVDALSTAAIGIGLGLSPFMLLSVGTLLVVAYLVLSINVYLESYALGRFSIGYGKVGPTEMRVLLIALNTALALGLDLRVHLLGVTVTALDAAGIVIGTGMCVLLAVRARRNLRALAEHEPAAARPGESGRRGGRLPGPGEHRRARGAAVFEPVLEDHLERPRDRDRAQRAEDPRHLRPDQHGDQDRQRRELHRPSVHERLQQMVLQLLIDDEEREHHDRRRGRVRERDQREDDRGEGRPGERDQVEDEDQQPERERERHAHDQQDDRGGRRRDE